MVLELQSTPTLQNMKVNGAKARKVARARYFTSTEISTRATGRTIKLTALANTSYRTVLSISETIKTI